MILEPAREADYPQIVDLINLAFRGTGPSASWNIEAGLIEGSRMTDSLLREDLSAKPHAHLLIVRDSTDRSILGTVWLEPVQNAIWYLGLLTVRPAQQKQQLGRALLTAAEKFARERGARC